MMNGALCSVTSKAQCSLLHKYCIITLVVMIRFILFDTGLKVNRLDMYGEKYKPFKGVKYVTKAGKFQVRT
jgi:hypothetical protein